MRQEREYRMFVISSGQPRPYADSRYHCRIEHWDYDLNGEHLHNPLEWHSDPNSDAAQEAVARSQTQLLEVAKAIFNAPEGFRTRNDLDGSASAYFGGWWEISYPEPGVIEVVKVSPFTD